ncbi:molybdopterin molybdotransferase MoeA [Falsiruegeria litorea]|uniref:molybdopterin molybdotransferase MoeA n=1 Tax=Falsiruegeria litorea TaxID=1280831 RepID=UPI001BFE84B9|nr:gephyrin-like molybdotransferase Glp [Falsiruegeria litorea]MBT8167668.1 molybdopterin molybdotransferase MoeA [Falsiruegeria litorea]
MTLFDRIDTPGCGCDTRDLAATLLPVDTALNRGLALVDPLTATEDLPLHQASGRVLARPVKARADLPRFDNSGMDGYALRLTDLNGTKTLPVCGTSAASDAPQPLPAGTAMRIFTGAPVPAGADTVVMQEWTTRTGNMVTFEKRPQTGSNIRRQGEDQRANATVLTAGQRLNARHLAICAGAGHGSVSVVSKPKIALLMTGDELIAPGAEATGGAIWDVNTPLLTSVLSDVADISFVYQVPDSFDAMIDAISSAAQDVDLVITSGGVSVGDRDHVKPALNLLGAEIAVSGVAIKPGKPITLSRLGRVPIISLPGNPLSAYVTWQVFGNPMLNKLCGLTEAVPPRRLVRAQTELRHKPGRCEYRPARFCGMDHSGLEVVECPSATHSGHLGPMAQADGLVLIPGDIDKTATGDLLEFMPF